MKHGKCSETEGTLGELFINLFTLHIVGVALPKSLLRETSELLDVACVSAFSVFHE